MKPAKTKGCEMARYWLFAEDLRQTVVSAPNLAAAAKKLEAWLRGLDWGDEGARVWGEVTRLTREGRRTDECADVTIDIEPQ